MEGDGRRAAGAAEGIPGGTPYLVALFVGLGACTAVPWPLYAWAAAVVLALVTVLILMPAAMDEAPDAIVRVGVAVAGLAVLPSRLLADNIHAGVGASLLAIPVLVVLAGAHHVRPEMWMAVAGVLLGLVVTAVVPLAWPVAPIVAVLYASAAAVRSMHSSRAPGPAS